MYLFESIKFMVHVTATPGTTCSYAMLGCCVLYMRPHRREIGQVAADRDGEVRVVEEEEEEESARMGKVSASSGTEVAESLPDDEREKLLSLGRSALACASESGSGPGSGPYLRLFCLEKLSQLPSWIHMSTFPLCKAFGLAAFLLVIIALMSVTVVRPAWDHWHMGFASLEGGEAQDPPRGLRQQLLLQMVSDGAIAIAYFSIPFELIYFVRKAGLFPYKWLLVLFSAFIVLCGATHAIAPFTYVIHTNRTRFVMTAAKLLTAAVSCATALVLVRVLPELLAIKVREISLRSKAEELDREVVVQRKKQETALFVRMLTHEIRSSLDRHTILKTTLTELGRILQLGNACLLMPTPDRTALQLTHCLVRPRAPTRRVLLSDPALQRVLAGNAAEVLLSSGAVAEAVEPGRRLEPGSLLAVRVPLLQTENFDLEEVRNQDGVQHALLVLVLPQGGARQWKMNDIALVEAVADQVAVALSHSAVLEHFKRSLEQLREQRQELAGMQEQARAAIDARANFLSAMNHEMRTPTHAIVAMLSLLEEMGPTEEQQAILRTVTASAQALHKLIDDVLDVSMLEDGSLALEVTAMDLREMLKAAECTYAQAAARKQLQLTLRMDPGLPRLALGDRRRLVQILSHVLDNAVRFSPYGGGAIVVSVSALPAVAPGIIPRGRQPMGLTAVPAPLLAGPSQGLGRGSPPVTSSGAGPSNREVPTPAVTPITPSLPGPHFWLVVQVQDTGIGVHPEQIPRLFDKFVQGDSSMSRKHGGLGLGLAICRGLCQLQGGNIVLESEGVGHGATVTFWLQLGVCGSQPGASEFRGIPVGLREGSELSVRLRDVGVLVVDDNEVNRLVSRRLLRSLGCQVEVVATGAACLSTLQRPNHGIRLVLLDICMPDMDGFEVAVRINQAYSRRERPLIFAYTANTERETRLRCHALGMDGIITKPVGRDDLGRILCSLLGL